MKKIVIFTTLLMLMGCFSNSQQEGKADAVVDLFNRNLGKDGTYICEARALTKNAVTVDLTWPTGTSEIVPMVLCKKLADNNAEIRLASSLFITGYVGKRKICEFEYDMYSGEVRRKF